METFSNNLKSSVKNWWLYLLAGILFIITSIIIFADPGESYISLSIVFSILLFVIGIMRTVAAASSRKTTKGWGWDLAFGIVEIILGLLLMFRPDITLLTLPFVFSFWLLLLGINLIAFCIDLKNNQTQGWGWILASAILLIILSLIAIFNYWFSMFMLVFMVGTFLLAAGVLYIIFSVRLRAIKKENNI